MNLRPFDPEAAKAGQKICWGTTARGVPIEFVAYDGHSDVCVRYEGGQLAIVQQDQLAMKPLGYCEDKPVYPGDVLYSKITKRNVTIAPGDPAYFEGWTWTPPRKPLCIIDGVEMFGGETVYLKDTEKIESIKLWIVRRADFKCQTLPFYKPFTSASDFTLTPPKKKTVLSLWRLLDGTIMTTEPVYRIKDAIKLHAVGVTEDGDVEVCDE